MPTACGSAAAPSPGGVPVGRKKGTGNARQAQASDPRLCRCLLVAHARERLRSWSTSWQGQQAGGTPAANPASYPRNETLYISGTQWGHRNNWNPIMDWQYATGTEGLVYENLFIYDPLKGEYKPWLAEKGDWASKNVYELTLRDGLTWSDGSLTSADVVHLRAGQVRVGPVPQPVGLDGEGRGGRRADGQVHLLRAPVPAVGQPPLQPTRSCPSTCGKAAREGRRHRRQREAGRQRALPVPDPQPGPDGLGEERQVVGQDRAQPRPSPGTSSTSSTPTTTPRLLVLQGGIDLSNNFLPGIATLVKGGYQVQTYFPELPRTCCRPTPPGWC